ncbi:PAS domain-containing protein [Ferrovibrio sp.]|jgi:hypothetical protein|uniref:PAS domain-containing protein n=1 Tax=Ferrovibrio sp. TaxID=1917215 RepID=UPI0035B4A39D
MLDLNRATFLLQQGYRYWDAKRAGKRMPSRADIDPIEMPALLPHVVLLEVLRDVEPDWPLDFRYRLMGSAVEAHLTMRYGGLRMSQIPHQKPPSRMWENFSMVVQSGKPLITQVPYIGPHKDFLAAQDLITPLSHDGKNVDMLLNFVDFISRQGFGPPPAEEPQLP